MEDNPDVLLYASRVAWSEFAEGCETREDVDRLLADFTVLEIDSEVAWQASRVSRKLSKTGLHIGDNDIWIAATALAYDLPVVTRNEGHFGRVSGLRVVTY